MSHSSLLRLAGLAGVVVSLSCAAPAAPGPIAPAHRGALPDVPASLTAPLPAAATRWIDSTVASLSLRDRVAQMMMIWVLGDYTSASDSSFAWTVDRIELDHVGGVVMSLGSPIEVAAKVNALQARSRIPLLVSSDVEPGLGRLEGGTFTPGLLRGGDATVLPSNMAIGATGSEAHAYVAGRIIGLESRAIGIHVAFAPAVDVNNNPSNPVINVRSFGEEPHAVARLGTAFVRGVQETGVVATLKHFPGHGDTDTDSHLALPIVTASRTRLDSMELMPFRAAFAAGAAAVMSAHIALPAIAHDSTPATLVPAIMRSLLRDTLGFRGLSFTDAMDMRGVGAGYGVDESSVRAIQAGADVLLMPADIPAAIAAITAAVERGEIPAARIDESVRRILEYKIRTGAIQRPLVPLDSLREVVGSSAHRMAAQSIADDAITLIRNDDGQIPLATRGRTAIITFTSETDVSAGRTFSGELRAMLPESRVLRINPATPRVRLDSLLRPGERVVLATFVRTIEGEGRFAVGEHVARWIDSVAITRPVTVVAFSNPYVIREFGWVSGYVATYGRGDAVERAAARAITGRIAFHGRAPISLPGFFQAGDGAVKDEPAPKSVEDSLRGLLDRAVRDSVFPGAIAVIGDRRGIMTQVSAGRIDWAADAPAPDLNTVWDMASLTKVIGMTTGMMQLVEQGRVVLDAPVQRYLPEWTGRNKDRVTVRHLLTHSAGLPAFRQLWKLTSTADSARAILINTPLDTLPGARMVYSDIGAILLGLIIERVSGESLDAYLVTHVFTPLGMRDTRYLPPTEWLPRTAPTERDPWRGRLLRGEVHDENAFFLERPVAHAGLFSSAADLSRFARALLNDGALDGARVVRAETVRDFTRVQNVLLSNRALGWETPTGGNSAGRVMRRPAYGHTGFTGTSMWIDPANDRFVILLTNRVNPTRENSRIGPVRTAVADLVTSQAMGARNAVRGTP
jgi:beta-glucosidase-like glycosyl hydrolase/CubicO group peptidase (beta-lactamase class C family)